MSERISYRGMERLLLEDGDHVRVVHAIDGEGNSVDPGPLTIQEGVDVSMPSADTEYSLVIPSGARELVMRLNDPTTGWRMSPTPGIVAAGGGFPVLGGETVVFRGPFAGQTIYVAHSAVAPKILKFLHE